jgi:hypothetical protein
MIVREDAYRTSQTAAFGSLAAHGCTLRDLWSRTKRLDRLRARIPQSTTRKLVAVSGACLQESFGTALDLGEYLGQPAVEVVHALFFAW